MSNVHDHPAERLRARSLRVTRQRVAVLRVLEHHPHRDAGFVLEEVNKTFGEISKQAVYNVLTDLAEARLVRRIDLVGTAAVYEIRDGDTHHHRVCRRCSAVIDADDVAIDMSIIGLPDRVGFVVDDVEIIYWGLCYDCDNLGARTPTDLYGDSKEH